MRALRLLWLVPPTVLGFLACEDDAGPFGPTLAFDAGGVNVGERPDATTIPPEAGVDAPATGGVSITVRRLGVGIADVRVLFHDATGAVTGEATTDANGKATTASGP